MKVQFVGDGGHAKNLRDICEQFGFNVVPEAEVKVLAFGALTPKKLEERFKQGKDMELFCLIHNAATISNKCAIEEGVQILANAVVSAGTWIGRLCIINTGAIIEHDARIGKGCHIAPGAVVLGNAVVGDFSFVGANAVVVQGCSVPARTFIKAGSIWKNK